LAIADWGTPFGIRHSSIRQSSVCNLQSAIDMPMHSPFVYIVGAGPGDPLLISVRGRRCLEAADVVVYDHRVSARLLRGARRENDCRLKTAD
jgi:hypothetical protein